VFSRVYCAFWCENTDFSGQIVYVQGVKKILVSLVIAAVTACAGNTITPPAPPPPTPPSPPSPPPPGTPANAISTALNQTTNGLNTDTLTWFDASGQARSAALVRTPQAGSKGGFLEQTTYKLPGGAIHTVNASNDARGFGYIVSHLKDPTPAGSDDDSPLGSELNNASSLVWQGTHHLIYQYTLNYPRWGVRGGVNTKFDMPVTVHWLFSTGRNQPLWTVTMDLSAAKDGEVVADSRAPYGDMNFSGSSGDLINGVMWGDTYHFASTGGPLTLNSGWDWSQVNTGAAYDALFTQGTDAEMGIVGTRVISKQDAGGYQGADGFRGATSATKSCPNAGDVHVMPCLYQWSFQSVNYSFGNEFSTATSSKRLAWGADWGYLGQSSYQPMNNNYAATPGSFPKRSYSTYIVLDPHTGNPSKTLSAQMKIIDDTTLSATGATVATGGIAGAGRTDQTAYSPIGYNHIYGTWEAALAANSATLSFNVPAGKALQRPVIVLRDYTNAKAPVSVQLNGATLSANTDYFASVRTGANELWITLGKDLPGGLSDLKITP
jgi:hypothetical protein